MALLVIAGVFTIIAIVLVVVGITFFSSASSADDEADRATRERRELEQTEAGTLVNTRAVAAAGRKVDDEVGNLIEAGNDLTARSDQLTDVRNAAIDKFNSGDTAGSRAQFENEARPLVADLEQALSVEDRALAAAQAAQRRLRAAV